MNLSPRDLTHIDEAINNLKQRNAELAQENLEIQVANKEILSKTSTDQVS